MLDKKTLMPKVIKALLFTALVIILVLTIDFPIYYAIFLIAFFWIKILPFTKFIDRKLSELHPSYETSHPLIRKAVPYMVYITLIIVMKILVVDVFVSGILQIPVKEQLYEFLDISPA